MKITPRLLKLEIKDEDNELVAIVRKIIYIRRKKDVL